MAPTQSSQMHTLPDSTKHHQCFCKTESVQHFLHIFDEFFSSVQWTQCEHPPPGVLSRKMRLQRGSEATWLEPGGL